jgi:hypothetical protein
LYPIDFYVKNREIRVMTLKKNYTNEYIYSCNEMFRLSENKCSDELLDSQYGCSERINLNGKEKIELSFGVMNIGTENTWSGGFVNMDDGCDNITWKDVESVKIPSITTYAGYSALNEHDFIYATKEEGQALWEIKSTNNLELPQGSYRIISMQRENQKYSFSFYDSWNFGLPGASFSSEIGKVDCSGFLIGENRVGWRFTPWVTEIVKFNSCNDWESLFSLPVMMMETFNSGALFDLTWFQK